MPSGSCSDDAGVWSPVARSGKKMGIDSGAAGNRQASAAPFPGDQRSNPARFALLALASGGMYSDSFIHPIQKNRERGYYSVWKFFLRK